MKILLDECVTAQLKNELRGLHVKTVVEMGWSGMKNGNLLASAESEFDILLTIDKNIAFQQKLDNRTLAVVVLDTESSKIEALREFLPQFLERLETFERGRLHVLKR
jgi:predicted nuclease of predicted toxin-antitoxin system